MAAVDTDEKEFCRESVSGGRFSERGIILSERAYADKRELRSVLVL